MKTMSWTAIALLVFAPVGALAFDDDAIKIRCDEEWGTNFSMVKYCRDQQRAAGRAFDILTAQAAEDETTAIILKHCENEWSKDYSMIMYCSKQQNTAVVALKNTPDDIPSDVNVTIRNDCVSEWLNDFAMVAYCVRQQSEAWRGLQ